MQHSEDLVPITTYAYNPSTHSWVPQNTFTKEVITDGKGKVRLATFNVLHDRFGAVHEYWIQSPKRNKNMVKLITELHPDILCLNEVTVNILELILQDPLIRSEYYVSDIPKTSTQTENMSIHERCPFGNVLLSRLPYNEAYYYQLKEPTCKRKVIFGVFSQLGESFMVAGMHITAYDNKKAVRKLQMEEIVTVISNSNFGDNVFMMGDFNFHSELENENIEPQFIDLWKSTHTQLKPSVLRPLSSLFASYMPYTSYQTEPLDEEDGYTYDSETNLFIPYYVPFERRRMRLDRIVMKQGCPFVADGKMHRFATEPVEPGSYLFTSDHYGLYVDMTCSGSRN